MKKTPIIILWMAITVIYFPSCKKCNPCDDPLLVKVPAQGFGNIEYQWEVSNAVQHSDGTLTSSISIVPPGTTTIHATKADSIHTTVYLQATDTLAGIHCITTTGKFGLTCTNSSGAIIIDGILPETRECNNLTRCCLKNQRLVLSNIDQYMNCTGDRKLSNGGIGITGYIKNCRGATDTVFLNVQFN